MVSLFFSFFENWAESLDVVHDNSMASIQVKGSYIERWMELVPKSNQVTLVSYFFYEAIYLLQL